MAFSKETIQTLLQSVEEAQRMLEVIDAKNLHEDAAKLTKLKSDFAAMHSKLLAEQNGQDLLTNQTAPVCEM